MELCVSFAPRHLKQGRRENVPKEFDVLAATGKFPRIAVHENLLLARTRMVRVMKDGKTYRIGEYLLEIGKKHFAAFNLTHKVKGYHGPHINPAGVFCMLEGKDQIMAYIADGKLDLPLLAIESAIWDIGSAMPYIDVDLEHWPLEETSERNES